MGITYVFIHRVNLRGDRVKAFKHIGELDVQGLFLDTKAICSVLS